MYIIFLKFNADFKDNRYIVRLCNTNKRINIIFSPHFISKIVRSSTRLYRKIKITPQMVEKIWKVIYKHCSYSLLSDVISSSDNFKILMSLGSNSFVVTDKIISDRK